MGKTIDVKEILKTSWGIVKQNAAFFVKIIGLFVVFIILITVLMGVSAFLESGVIFVLLIPLMLLPALLIPGYIKAVIQMADGQKPELAVLWSAMGSLLPIIVAGIIIGIIASLGLLFFIIPGIYVLIVTSFFTYFIIDQKMGAVESLQASRQLVSGGIGQLIKLLVIMVVISMLIGWIPVIGAIFTSILGLVQAVAMALIYRRWSGTEPNTTNSPSDQSEMHPPVTSNIPSPTEMTELENITPDPKEFRQMKPAEIPELENITPDSLPTNQPVQVSPDVAKEKVANTPPPAPGVLTPKVEPAA